MCALFVLWGKVAKVVMYRVKVESGCRRSYEAMAGKLRKGRYGKHCRWGTVTTPEDVETGP